MAFKNIGQTCFINASLQCLLHLDAVNDLIVQPMAVSSPEQSLYNEYVALRDLARGNRIITPTRFVAFVRHVAAFLKVDQFQSTAQCDASEFIRFMVRCLNTAMKHDRPIPEPAFAQHFKNDYSDLIPLLYGVQDTMIDGKSVAQEPFFFLELPIPDRPDVTLLDCLQLYTSPEAIDQREKRTAITRFPPILFISLVRFNARGLKNNAHVQVPESLTLEARAYTLKYVCNHMGGVGGGHYTASVRTSQWFLVDDDTVCPTPRPTQNAYYMVYVSS